MNTIKRHKPKQVQNFLWSKDLAYFVGLLVTDGCLSSDGRHIIFTSKDIERIGNVIRILKLNIKIGNTRNKLAEAYRIQIGNVQLYDWLISIGITPNKSLTIGEIKLPDEFFVDFLRGHLDGDGSINTYVDKYNTKLSSKYIYNRIFTTFISGSEDHLIWLQKKIQYNLRLNGARHKSKYIKGKNQMNILKFAKKESIELLNKIYYREDVVCLSRKKLVFKNYLKTSPPVLRAVG